MKNNLKFKINKNFKPKKILQKNLKNKNKYIGLLPWRNNLLRGRSRKQTIFHPQRQLRTSSKRIQQTKPL